MSLDNILLKESVESLSFNEDSFVITARYKNNKVRQYSVENYYFYEIMNIYRKSKRYLHSNVLRSFDDKNKSSYRLIGFYIDYK